MGNESAGGIRGKLGSIRVVMTLWNVGILALLLTGLGVALRYTMQQRIGHEIDQGMANFAHRIQRGFNSPRAEGNDMPGWLRRRMRENPNANNPTAPNSAAASGPRGGASPRAMGLAAPPGPRPSDNGNSNPPPNPYPLALLDVNGQSLFPGAGAALASKPWDPASFAKSLQGREIYSTVLVRKARVRVFSVPLKRDGKTIGVAQVTNDQAVIPEALGWLTHTLLAFIPAVLLIAGIVGGFLTSRMIRPVRQLADAAEQIEGNNLHGRLPVAGTDEFSELAVTFNNMLERLESAFRQLEESSEQQRRFTGDASHELRTPLTIIKANASLALSGERTPEQYKQSIMAINQAADRMTRLVQDLLLLARSDAGQMEMPLKTVVVKDVLEEAVDAMAHSDGRTATIDIPDEALTVAGNYEMLVRLVTNLLSNAARHTPADGKISVRAVRQGENVVLSFLDTGEGIAPEHLAHLTERFYRVDAARSSADGGTGLGLAIVQTIVGLHHGEMAIESALGKGTTVKVTLQAARPVLEPPADSPAEPALHPARATSAARA
ncbi:MAG TPA: ATP-binding protein [Capsulimonadaceae bacterium]|nr:ATP-binding protein [Capsulimonadaceae bacterium]